MDERGRQNSSTESLMLETGERRHPRASSAEPGPRPSGLVSIRFFGSAGAGTSPVEPGLSNHQPASPKENFMKDSDTLNLKRTSVDGFSDTNRQLPVVKRGRGRPRTKSNFIQKANDIPVTILPPLARSKPSGSVPTINIHELRPVITQPASIGFPRILPRGIHTSVHQRNYSVPTFPFHLGQQPNSMAQAQMIMNKSAAATYNYTLENRDPDVSKPMVTTRSSSLTSSSPELDVLRLMSEACEIHQSGRPSDIGRPSASGHSNTLAPKQRRGRKPRAPRLEPAIELSTLRKILPRPSSSAPTLLLPQANNQPQP